MFRKTCRQGWRLASEAGPAGCFFGARPSRTCPSPPAPSRGESATVGRRSAAGPGCFFGEGPSWLWHAMAIGEMLHETGFEKFARAASRRVMGPMDGGVWFFRTTKKLSPAARYTLGGSAPGPPGYLCENDGAKCIQISERSLLNCVAATFLAAREHAIRMDDAVQAGTPMTVESDGALRGAFLFSGLAGVRVPEMAELSAHPCRPAR